MTKKEFVVEVYSADDGDIFLWQPPKDWLPPIPIKKELIRCKDCKFNKGYCENEDLHFHLEPLGFDGGALFETRPDFYCAYGKRKEEFDCNDCYYSMQNCNDISICCEDETALCDNFEPVEERKEE